MADGQPMHELVEGLLRAFEPKEGGPILEPAALAEWRRRVRGAADKAELAPQLVAVAARFVGAGAAPAAGQVVTLVVDLLGLDEAVARLHAAGVSTDEARKLVREARGTTSPLAAGLAPPAGKKR